MIVDGRASSVPTDFDVAVVGSGPAGSTVAGALAARGVRVAMIEAGGTRPTLRSQRMLLDRPTGSAYWNLATVRTRMLGGSGNRWGGISRPLDPWDFAPREWVAHSGWPIGWDDVAGYVERAGELLDLPPDPDEQYRCARPDEPSASGFEIARYRLSPRVRWGAELARAAARSGPTVLLNLQVTGLHLRPGSRDVGWVEARSFRGPTHRISARRFVLAAGGIENARLLLLSRGQDGRSLGNEHDTVGRYFMEHVHAPIAHLEPAGALSDWTSYEDAGWPRLVRALVPAESLQRAEHLLNASIAVGPLGYIGAPPFARLDYRLGFAYERLLARLAAHEITMRLPRPRRRGQPEATRRLVVYRGEQPPRPENRVVLGDDVDELGQRRAHLQWSLGAPELDNVPAVFELFRARAAEQGWGTLSPMIDGWREQIIGGPHHMGTTRMSADPVAGVVDANCKVHTVGNLYVAGSSVFATGGHANPTLTLVALALRLADHLAGTRG